jgi:hypothetical protein
LTSAGVNDIVHSPPITYKLEFLFEDGCSNRCILKLGYEHRRIDLVHCILKLC